MYEAVNLLSGPRTTSTGDHLNVSGQSALFLEPNAVHCNIRIKVQKTRHNMQHGGVYSAMYM